MSSSHFALLRANGQITSKRQKIFRMIWLCQLLDGKCRCVRSEFLEVHVGLEMLLYVDSAASSSMYSAATSAHQGETAELKFMFSSNDHVQQQLEMTYHSASFGSLTV